jgi:hypothetical protein
VLHGLLAFRFDRLDLHAEGQAHRAGKLFQANMDFLSALPPEAMATPVPQAALPGAPLSGAVLDLRERACGSAILRTSRIR